MKYKVGDVVKLRDDLEDDKEYGCGIHFVSSMNHLKRKPVVIEVCEKESCGEWYRVEDAYWNITDEMIEGLWEECKPKLKLIDVLNMIAKGELKEGTKVKWDVFEYTYREDEFADECLERRDSDNKIVDILEDMYLRHLTAEVELIEPPCEHEWKDIETHRMGEGIIRRFRRCVKCGLEEVTEERNVGADKTIEPTKTEELYKDDVLCLTECQAIGKMIDKLNEVIRMVNAITNLLN